MVQWPLMLFIVMWYCFQVGRVNLCCVSGIPLYLSVAAAAEEAKPGNDHLSHVWTFFATGFPAD